MTVFEALPALIPYQPAFLVMALLSMVAILLSFLGAPLAFLSGEQVPGMPLRQDHAALSFRALRAYSNTVENLPAFALALLAAIIAGVSPFWVNTLVWLFLGFRLAYWAVYYAGLGNPAGGPRTLCYVGGLTSNAVLAGLAIYALL